MQSSEPQCANANAGPCCTAHGEAAWHEVHVCQTYQPVNEDRIECLLSMGFRPDEAVSYERLEAIENTLIDRAEAGDTSANKPLKQLQRHLWSIDEMVRDRRRSEDAVSHVLEAVLA